jgi:hypothetical protein
LSPRHRRWRCHETMGERLLDVYGTLGFERRRALLGAATRCDP